MGLPPGTKITCAPQDEVEQLQPQLDALLEILGHPEALVTDWSTFADFLCFGQTQEEAQDELCRRLTAAGIWTEVNVEDTLVHACRVIKRNDPHWPGQGGLQ